MFGFLKKKLKEGIEKISKKVKQKEEEKIEEVVEEVKEEEHLEEPKEELVKEVEKELEEEIEGVKITYFVHGTTTDNEERKSTGWAPGKLSELGKKQSIELKDKIKGKRFDVVFCSDLKRSVNSAKLTWKNEIQIIQDKRLREVNYGDLTQADSDKVEPFKIDHIDKPFPSGESYKDVEKRIAEFLNYLFDNYEGKHVAIVSHQAPQLALDVLLKGKTWEQAIKEDWRLTKNWQPGWGYELEEKVGNYQDEKTGRWIVISMKEDKLVLEAWGEEYVISPLSQTSFRALDAPFDNSIDFLPDQKGLIRKAKLTVEGDEINLRKAPQLKPLTPSQMKEYAGEYYNDELPVTYKLVVEKDALLFKHKNAPQDALKHMDRDKFTAGWFNIEFVRNQRKKVTGFVLGAGRAANIEFVKK